MAKKKKNSSVIRGTASKKEQGPPKKPKPGAAGSRATPASKATSPSKATPAPSKPSPRDREAKKSIGAKTRIEAKKRIVEPQVRPLPIGTLQPQDQEEPWAGPLEGEVADPELVVVAMGSSAGGLEVLSEILSALEPDTGACYVIVQHLSPDYRSAMVELLAPKCSMRVVQARDGMRLEPDRVHVFPPNADMAVRNGHLSLGPRPEGKAGYTPINRFFRSIAEDPTIRPVGVVLTGTSSDGAAGIRDIKAAGGITMAQDPASAKFDIMPRAAISSGMVDLVLSPAGIAQELNRIVQHPSIRAARRDPADNRLDISQEEFGEIFELLRTQTGVDFSHYKSPTIRRRLQRRLALHKVDGMGSYLRMLRGNEDEALALYNDLLIQVTHFFREPKALETLREVVFPQLIADRAGDDPAPLRLWVPGCATGEEAYSLAIEILDFLHTKKGHIPVQIFATDVSESAIERARGGTYPETIEDEVSPERLRRYFVHTDSRFRVSKQIRDLCVFARQDLTRDPPFSRIDLIVCRNVMIYLSQPTQKRLLTVFHYALKTNGYLLLGGSESIGPASELFSQADKRVRLFIKRPGETPPRGIASAGRLPFSPPGRAHRAAEIDGEADQARSLQTQVNRLLIERYSPPGVIVDDEMRIIQFQGKTGLFLEAPPGDATLNLFKMAREGLLHGLRSAVHQARQQKGPARKEGLQVRHNGNEYLVELEVTQLLTETAPYYMVMFQRCLEVPKKIAEPAKAERGKKLTKQEAANRKDAAERKEAAERLQDELNASREYLQSIIQDLETANEELQSANEEILSSNEELQSSNEELDTAREELQATNEELNTVNEELQGRNDELSRANSDLMNLLANVQIAIVMVSLDLRIRRFTPAAERILNIMPTDMGRPIGHIKPNIDAPDLGQRIAHVIDAVVTDEFEAQDRQGRWYSLRIRPYKDAENRIDGSVLSLFDVDAMKELETKIGLELDFAERVLDTITQPILVLNEDLTVRAANNAFCHEFQLNKPEITGRRIDELGKEQWQMPKLREALEKVLPENEAFENLIVEQNFADGSRRIRLNGRRLEGINGPFILLTFEEDS